MFFCSKLTCLFIFLMKVVYILDQVRALEYEMLQRIKHQGLDITPRILIVSRDLARFSFTWVNKFRRPC